jgi:hypothetical protein
MNLGEHNNGLTSPERFFGPSVHPQKTKRRVRVSLGRAAKMALMVPSGRDAENDCVRHIWGKEVGWVLQYLYIYIYINTM